MSNPPFFIETQKEEAIVSFPSNLTPVAVEAALKRSFHRSFFNKYERLIFDLKNVNWCDIFSLSLIALWLYELKKRGKQLTLIYPEKHQVHKIFVCYGLDDFLKTHEIKIHKEQLDVRYIANRDVLQSPTPYYPLTFFNQIEFVNLLKDLRYGNRLEIVLAGLSEADIVKSGAIRDIIIRELGENIFLHTNGANAHIIMTKLSYINARPTFDIAPDGARKKRTKSIEEKFISNQVKQPVLEVVIGDKGEGIFTTLRKAYLKDESLVNKKEDPHECDILEYAFKYHSSRRPLEERIKEIRSRIECDSIASAPPTGLYQLKELIKEYHGLLYIRSGSSIICYDFFDKHGQEHIIRSDTIPGWKSLANFGGTQFRIIVPFQKPPDKTSRRHFDFFAGREFFKIHHYEYVALDNYFSFEGAGDLAKDAESLYSFCAAIDRIISQYEKKRVVVFIDFALSYKISSKVIHYLIWELIQRQTLLKTFVAISFDLQNKRYFQDISSNFIHLRISPLLAFDENYYPHLIGVDLKTAQMFNKISSNLGGYTKVEEDFAERNKHLFDYDPDKDCYVLTLSQDKIFRAVREGIAGRLQKILLDPTWEIFNPNIKVLLPSQIYCKGYFEIYKVIKDQKLINYLLRWLSTAIFEFDPSIIISVGKETGTIVQVLLNKCEIFKQEKIKHINLHTRKRYSAANLTAILGIEKGEKVILFTDVIGTGETLKSLFNFMPQTNIRCVLTIVDARTEDINTFEIRDTKIPLKRILFRSLTYFDRLPPEWSYTEIHQIDPDTHALIQTRAKAKGALWKDVEYLTIEFSIWLDAIFSL